MSQPLSPDILVYDLVPAADPRVSPDGARIVYALTTAERDKPRPSSQLWTCAIDGTDARRLTWSGERNGGARWSPDGRRLAFISDRAERSGIFVLPMEGSGEAREVTRHAGQIGDLAWSPDGASLAYTVLVDSADLEGTGTSPDGAPRVRVTRRIDYKQDNRGYLGDARLQVFVADVAAGTRQQVTTDAMDHNGPEWSPDGQWLATQVPNRNGMHSQLHLIRVDGGETGETGETVVVGPEDGVVGTWAWSPSGDRILFAGDVTQTFQLDFFVYDVASGATRRLTDDLRYAPDTGFPTILPPAQPAWLDDRHALFHAMRGGASLLAIVDCKSGQVEEVRQWEALHAGLSVDRARRYAVQARASLDSFGELAVVDLSSRQMTAITPSAQTTAVLAERPPARWERLTVERGGEQVEAWLLRPADFDPSRRYPVVLDVHGGPHNFYGYTFNAIQQCLATNGFLVVCANPRGSASYGRRFVRQVVRDWAGEDFLDLMTVVDTVLERPYADPARAGVYGYSYGGFMTAWTIGHTNRFRAAVCGAPVFDMESFYGTSDIGHSFGELEFGTGPHEGREWYAAHSPSTYAHQARTPTLIIHGEADDRCPIGQGEQMFVALLKAGCEVEFARYPGGSHLFLRNGPLTHRADAIARILGWFTTYLGEPRSTGSDTGE